MQIPAELQDKINKAAADIKNSKFLTAFTGAGISVESGIPPFRGAGGLWNKYDPRMIEIDFFQQNPEQSWAEIKKIFYSRPRLKPFLSVQWENLSRYKCYRQPHEPVRTAGRELFGGRVRDGDIRARLGAITGRKAA